MLYELCICSDNRIIPNNNYANKCPKAFKFLFYYYNNIVAFVTFVTYEILLTVCYKVFISVHREIRLIINLLLYLIRN